MKRGRILLNVMSGDHLFRLLGSGEERCLFAFSDLFVDYSLWWDVFFFFPPIFNRFLHAAKHCTELPLPRTFNVYSDYTNKLA